MSDTTLSERINFRPAPGDKEALECAAAQMGATASTVLRDLLRAWLKRQTKNSERSRA